MNKEENQLVHLLNKVLISSGDVYVDLMELPSDAAGGAALEEAFNIKIEEILNEEPTHGTAEKLKKINILFNRFNKYAIGGGKGKLTTPGDDIFNKFISKKWTMQPLVQLSVQSPVQLPSLLPYSLFLKNYLIKNQRV